MARATYVDLIVEVRAQIDVSDDQAYAWLLDRARVWNAEASWLLTSTAFPADGSRYYDLPGDCVWIEAVLLGPKPYQRSTFPALDARYAGSWGSGFCGVYAEGANANGDLVLQIHPDSSDPAAVLNLRYVADVPDDRDQSPPFPVDFDEALVEGAIAIGLARMDERFDSANYFDERFRNGGDRLKRRRHGVIGRGATAIRVLT